MKPLIICVDSREKKPLTLPSELMVDTGLVRPSLVQVRSVVSRMETADYAIQGLERLALIERKGSLREIAGNVLTKDVKRFTDELVRLRDHCRYPMLMAEGTLSEYLTPTKDVPFPGPTLDRLLRMLRQHEVHFLLLPASTISTRRAVGELLVRQLIAATNWPNPDKLPKPA